MALALDEKTVRHVAQLARLDLSDEEVAMFARQLSRILEYFEKLLAMAHQCQLCTDHHNKTPPTRCRGPHAPTAGIP